MDDFVPSEFYLSQNYPNPFKGKTIIKYCVAYKTRVQLTVYNSEGGVIEKLVDEEKRPGTYEIEFSVSACHSRESGNLPAGRQGPKEGTYFYRLEAGDYLREKKMEIKK
jgi:5-hydroxyisourate hydrolase-like protein (transthyretin family)